MKDCPICEGMLKEVEKYGVIIDICPRCRGIWLDRGELEKIISIAKDYRSDDDDFYEHRRPKDYEKHHHEDRYGDHYYKKKKKRGLFDVFGDLFD